LLWIRCSMTPAEMSLMENAKALKQRHSKEFAVFTHRISRCCRLDKLHHVFQFDGMSDGTHARAGND
jgi:hypothetical protein